MDDYEGLLAETVVFKGHEDDAVAGYLARPLGAGPFPGVIVIHEVFGLVPHIKEIALRFATRGYVAVAPDLHYRDGPGDVDDVASAVRAAGGVPDERCIGDVGGALDLLQSLPYCTGRVGVIGYCSGGRQTYVVACNVQGIEAAVDCYGGRVVAGPGDLNERQPIAPIDMTEQLGCPLLGLFGADDANPSPEQVAQIEQELTRHGKAYEFQVYEGAGHGFFADYRPSYSQEAAVDGWERVLAWFAKNLI